MAAAHARRLVLVVAADIVRLVMERPGQKRPDRVVRAALRARIQPDPGLRQRQPRASADAAADERVDRVGLQKSGAPCPLPIVSTIADETIRPSVTS